MIISRKTISWLLGTILVLIIIIKLSVSSYFDDGGFFSNLITELIGAIITFIVIDNVLNYNEEKEKKRLQAVAIRSLRQPIRRYLWAWIHASTNEEIASANLQTTAISEYITSNIFIDRIRARSFNDPFTTSALLGNDRPLREKFPEMIEGFQNDIKDVLRTYSYALDAELIRQLQHFGDEAHLYNNIRLRKAINVGNNVWFESVDVENIRAHFNEFNRLMNKYNNNVEETEKWTNQNLMNLNMVSGQVPNVRW